MRSLSLEGKLGCAATCLAEKLKPFAPTQVIYIETGGARLGKRIAAILQIPAAGLDIRYPFSRISSSLARCLLFPVKEVIYRFTSPSIRIQRTPCVNTEARIALIDDSASSGKTLGVALEYLSSLGVSRDKIRTAVFRTGRRALSAVDFTIRF